MLQPISPFIRLDSADNVVVARHAVEGGVQVPAEGFTTLGEVPAGHKVAARAIAAGEPVLKYNTVIGYVAQESPAGTWMHSHNIVFDDVEKDYAFSQRYVPTVYVPESERATFQGIVREDGRVATRNFLGVFVMGNSAPPSRARSRTISTRSGWPIFPMSTGWCRSSTKWAAALR